LPGRVFTLVEFAYNNDYQSLIKITPFKFLYCRTHVRWDRLEDKFLIGPEMIQEVEDKMKTIQRRSKEAQNIQKHYLDARITNRSYK